MEVPETRLTPPSEHLDDWLVKGRLYHPGSTHEHLRASKEAAAGARDVVFQRVVQGDLLAVVTLTGPDGQLLYAGAQRASAVYPEPFGVSVRARTVPLPGALASQVAALLRELGWWGIAELQFVQDADGRAQLIDLNGRFFGSLALTTAAGPDLPSAWVKVATGQQPVLGGAETGVRYQWLEGDLRRALAAPSPLPAVGAALTQALGATHSLWSRDDPGPALAFAALLARRAARKVGRR